MPARIDASLPLHGWTVLSLRPRGQHGGLRAASARLGARLLALSPNVIELRDDPFTREALHKVLAADIVLFTSPNAVRSAATLQALLPERGQRVLAVGSGTRRALRRLGIAAQAPARMDSEGLLAMAALDDVAGRRIGLATGAGGRNLLAPTLRQRGAQVVRADTYGRVPVALSARAQGRLATVLSSPQRVLLALSSADALESLLSQAPPAVRSALADIAVVAASARLADTARGAGFRRIAIASSPRPAALLHAATEAFV